MKYSDGTSDSKFEARCKFDVAGQTNAGLVRENNEDQFLILEMEKNASVLDASFQIDESEDVLNGSRALAMVVADGVGGAPAGERASQLAAETILRHLRENMPWFIRLHNKHEIELVNALKASVRKCEQAVEFESHLIPSESGMATTLTLAYVIWPSLYVIHIGDSRCYISRNSELLQITRDHTYAQALLEEGQLEKHELKTNQYSNVLLNSIGRGMSELHPEVNNFALQLGDRILLCSDGLSDMLDDDDIAAELNASSTSENACQRLVDSALQSGGRDNVTVIVCEPTLVSG